MNLQQGRFSVQKISHIVMLTSYGIVVVETGLNDWPEYPKQQMCPYGHVATGTSQPAHINHGR